MGPERSGNVLDILKSYNLKGLEIDSRLCGVWNVSGEGEIEAVAAAGEQALAGLVWDI